MHPKHGAAKARSCVRPAGRYAFVELRTEELATTAMTLDKTELLGRPMNIGRPKGYVPGTSAPGVRETVTVFGILRAGLMLLATARLPCSIHVRRLTKASFVLEGLAKAQLEVCMCAAPGLVM